MMRANMHCTNLGENIYEELMNVLSEKIPHIRKNVLRKMLLSTTSKFLCHCKVALQALGRAGFQGNHGKTHV